MAGAGATRPAAVARAAPGAGAARVDAAHLLRPRRRAWLGAAVDPAPSPPVADSPAPSAADLFHFTRTITGAAGSEYRIDSRLVTWDDYNAKLRSLGILVKARDFLVFQGDVESIASKNPKEPTALLEQISGSDELRRECDELEEQKASAEENSALVYQEKRTIVMERKQKKAQKEECLQQDLV